MPRLLIVGVVIAVAFTLYSLMDAAMTDQSRARGVSKPVWIVIIVLLPVIGGLLWMFIGKGSTTQTPPRPSPPDDDPRFSGTRMSDAELDAHLRDLEARLQELDEEVFPGEEPRSKPAESDGSGRPDSTGTPNGSNGSGERTPGEQDPER